MARIQLASNLDDARGKIGNIVYSKGRSVHTQRKRVKPTNPQTSYQNEVRTRFSAISSSWRTLEQDQILAWNEAAKQITNSNVFGGKYHPNGFTYYQKCNNLLLLLGYALQILPPTIKAAPKIGGTDTIDQATHKMEFSLNAPLNPGDFVIISISPRLSRGKSKFSRKDTRILKVLKYGDIFPYNAADDWESHFGSYINTWGLIFKFIEIGNCDVVGAGTWSYGLNQWEMSQDYLADLQNWGY